LHKDISAQTSAAFYATSTTRTLISYFQSSGDPSEYIYSLRGLSTSMA